MSVKYFDPEEIKKAIRILKPDNELFEVRLIAGTMVRSGYFNDAETLLSQLREQNLANTSVYITLQRLHKGCEARLQYGRFLETGKLKLPTTSDHDITAYEWLPIDLDPVRPAGISSTKAEMTEAYALRVQIAAYMEAQGYKQHITACSGNGYHLLYRIDWEKTPETVDRVQGILNRLDELFSNDAVKVDITNYNPSRIFKLYGTLAQKGRSTTDRPHRISKLLEVIA